MFSDEDRQRNLRSFQKRARILLTDSERDYLHDVLKHYQTYKDVHRLMMSLRSSLDTPAKLDLLREIRGLIPPGHLRQFDEMAPYDKMAHPFHPPGSDNVWRRMPSWHGRSSHSNPQSSDWIQCKF
ncbi:Harmonin [Holothuria leucospilota]|uniref:Harmonin n=1 Tax=Holothuria leucospilota TaxID=206669 RepID=A0A9Q0YTL0_HOLLE|nr:Harmonin [Holothuria leucospilota]